MRSCLRGGLLDLHPVVGREVAGVVGPVLDGGVVILDFNLALLVLFRRDRVESKNAEEVGLVL